MDLVDLISAGGVDEGYQGVRRAEAGDASVAGDEGSEEKTKRQGQLQRTDDWAATSSPSRKKGCEEKVHDASPAPSRVIRLSKNI